MGSCCPRSVPGTGRTSCARLRGKKKRSRSARTRKACCSNAGHTSRAFCNRPDCLWGGCTEIAQREPSCCRGAAARWRCPAQRMPRWAGTGAKSNIAFPGSGERSILRGRGGEKSSKQRMPRWGQLGCRCCSSTWLPEHSAPRETPLGTLVPGGRRFGSPPMGSW